jgi:cytidylate kinase
MNQTAVSWLTEELMQHLSDEQKVSLIGLFTIAEDMERQQLLDFGYRVRQCEDIDHVYTGRLCSFKTYPERLYEDYFIQPTIKRAVQRIARRKGKDYAPSVHEIQKEIDEQS